MFCCTELNPGLILLSLILEPHFWKCRRLNTESFDWTSWSASYEPAYPSSLYFSFTHFTHRCGPLAGLWQPRNLMAVDGFHLCKSPSFLSFKRPPRAWERSPQRLATSLLIQDEGYYSAGSDTKICLMISYAAKEANYQGNSLYLPKSQIRLRLEFRAPSISLRANTLKGERGWFSKQTLRRTE